MVIVSGHLIILGENMSLPHEKLRFCDIEDYTWHLMHAEQVLYHWATLSYRNPFVFPKANI